MVKTEPEIFYLGSIKATTNHIEEPDDRAHMIKEVVDESEEFDNEINESEEFDNEINEEEVDEIKEPTNENMLIKMFDMIKDMSKRMENIKERLKRIEKDVNFTNESMIEFTDVVESNHDEFKHYVDEKFEKMNSRMVSIMIKRMNLRYSELEGKFNYIDDWYDEDDDEKEIESIDDDTLDRSMVGRLQWSTQLRADVCYDINANLDKNEEIEVDELNNKKDIEKEIDKKVEDKHEVNESILFEDIEKWSEIDTEPKDSKSEDEDSSL